MGIFLTNQMVHYLLIKMTISQMTNQMVHTILVLKTTPVTMDMSKSTCPKWQSGILTSIKIGYFKNKFVSKKNQEFY